MNVMPCVGARDCDRVRGGRLVPRRRCGSDGPTRSAATPGAVLDGAASCIAAVSTTAAAVGAHDADRSTMSVAGLDAGERQPSTADGVTDFATGDSRSRWTERDVRRARMMRARSPPAAHVEMRIGRRRRLRAAARSRSAHVHRRQGVGQHVRHDECAARQSGTRDPSDKRIPRSILDYLADGVDGVEEVGTETIRRRRHDALPRVIDFGEGARPAADVPRRCDELGIDRQDRCIDVLVAMRGSTATASLDVWIELRWTSLRRMSAGMTGRRRGRR